MTDDPLDILLLPPADETGEERAVRLEREEEARRVSASIDASIKAEKAASRKKRVVRLLLLGQSESGKSTTLRQFQRLYTPSAFREERVVWKAIIQLNIVRSINTILDTVSLFESSPRSRSASRPRHYSDDEEEPRPAPLSYPPSPPGYPPTDFPHTIHPPLHQPSFHHSFYNSQPLPPISIPPYSILSPSSYSFDTLKSRLSTPLAQIEQLLISRLVDNADVNGSLEYEGVPQSSSPDFPPTTSSSSGEVFVRPNMGWKGALARAARLTRRGRQRPDSSSSSSSLDPFQIEQTLHALKHDMITLWSDPGVREVLKRRKVRMEEGSGLYVSFLFQYMYIDIPQLFKRPV